jgi:outer membrane protein assembly factor BamB
MAGGSTQGRFGVAIFRGSAVAALLMGGSALHPAIAGDWTTYAGSAQRLGYNGYETILTASAVPNVKLHWEAKTHSSSNTQPLYVEQVPTLNGTHDEVFSTTNSGMVFAFNAATGQTDWSVQLPTSQAQNAPCVTVGEGIKGTPTINPAAQMMYVVDGNGALHALQIGTGTESTGYPVQVVDPTNLALGAFNHTSPTKVADKLFITTSDRGSCEALGLPFHGGVMAFNIKTAQVENSFFPVKKPTGGGGIWGPGGAMYDPITDRLFVATGNALATPTDGRLAESIVALSVRTKVLDSDTPKGPILTKTGDYDFSSTPTPIDAQGCPPLLVALNKTGWIYVYQRNALANGPTQTMDISDGHAHGTLYGMAAYDPSAQLLFINNPLSSKDGSVTNGAIAMQVTSPSCTLGIAWQTTYGTDKFSPNTRSTDPTVAGGVVWLVTGAGKSVLALDEMTGAPLWSSGSTIRSPTTTPVLIADGQMFVQDNGKLLAWGL